MIEQWFVVPVVAVPELGNVPKYFDRDGIEEFAGTIFEFPTDSFLPFAGEEMFIVRFRGDAEALDAVEAESDAYTRQEYGIPEEAVAGWLNENVDYGYELAFEDWEERFLSS